MLSKASKIVCLCCLVSFSSEISRADEEIFYALCPKSLNNPFWDDVRTGMEKAAEELGVKAEFVAPPVADANQQVQKIEALLERGVAGIGISPNVPDSVIEVIEKARKKGIPVICFDSDSPDSRRLCYVGTFNEEAGYEAGKLMKKFLPEGGKVLVVSGGAGALNHQERVSGFERAVKNSPIQVASTVYCNDDLNRAAQLIEGYALANPDLKGIFCSASWAISAANVRKEKGLKVVIIGFDTVPAEVDLVREGLIEGLVGQNPVNMGYQSIMTLDKLRKAGGKMEEIADDVDTGCVVVTKETLEKKQKEESKLPFDSRAFSADEGCRWKTAEMDNLLMNAHYITGPSGEQNHADWLAALRKYREAIREGSQPPVLDMVFDGNRAWTRLSKELALPFALKAGDELEVSLEARWIEGGNRIGVAFDARDPKAWCWRGWSGVVGSLSIPTDGSWHELTSKVTVPDLGQEGNAIQPILGMDGTFDQTKSHVEIRGVSFSLQDPARMKALEAGVEELPGVGLNRDIYGREDLRWVAGTHTCQKTLVWDKAFYDVESGTYTFDSVLEDGMKEFGGYDIVVLWQGYPRLGFDERNQFDMYRDLPGGLTALREQVRMAQSKGVKFFIDYNPWDTGTRREPKSDEESLADLVAEIGADGIFLDTMTGTGAGLRNAVDRKRKGVAFIPEIHPPIEQLGVCSGSWAQYLNDPFSPGLLHLKWLEPRHAQYQTKRWETSHRAEMETAFFNGSGMMIWENIFGTYNPYPIDERLLWKRCSAILKRYKDIFTSEDWLPFPPTLSPNLHAQIWSRDGISLVTFLNTGETLQDAPLIELDKKPGMLYLDLWNGKRYRETVSGGKVRITGSINRLGCLLVVPHVQTGEDLVQFLEQQQLLAALNPTQDTRNFALSVLDPKKIKPTAPAAPDQAPKGMVLVPAASFHMRFKHMRRECGTYPDPGTPKEKWKEFLWGSPFDQILERDFGVIEMKPFFIDEAEVSNASYKEFLEKSGYQPKSKENFLKHWKNGVMPPDLADHPVVYVDLEDARAYARWAGKRLPAEAEWQLAAQGIDGREWPWGNAYDPAKCNTTGTHTLPVRSLPEGRSPYGCYHMSGNVWEWTESERDDGHVRFTVLRGGSYYKAEGSIWYAPGGPLPCTTHAKFLLMAPSLDRCSTVGFRCVVDVR